MAKMSHAVYIGTQPRLCGHTAMTFTTNNPNFIKVQVDDLRHRWSHSWKRQPRKLWKDDWKDAR